MKTEWTYEGRTALEDLVERHGFAEVLRELQRVAQGQAAGLVECSEDEDCDEARRMADIDKLLGDAAHSADALENY
jgi:hypothetical protein